MDDLLGAASSLDWISPLIALFNDVVNGPGHRFNIPYDCGWSGRAIARLLRRYGIKSWGLMVVGRTLTITVRRTQARFAQYLLDREGIPIEAGVVDPTRRRATRPPSGRSGNMRDPVRDLRDIGIL